MLQIRHYVFEKPWNRVHICIVIVKERLLARQAKLEKIYFGYVHGIIICWSCVGLLRTFGQPATHLFFPRSKVRKDIFFELFQKDWFQKRQEAAKDILLFSDMFMGL